ncbi:hypothetical protein MRY16398_07020 [Phytobacter sp. MRY16-398]|nr:hypothetical protein MRY16398_07020 [Phytobacter sp. MRY16-398]
MHDIKYRGFNTIGKNFASSGKVLPRTMKTKPSPHENIINKNQLNTNIRILVTEYSSPKTHTIAISIKYTAAYIKVSRDALAMIVSIGFTGR